MYVHEKLLSIRRKARARGVPFPRYAYNWEQLEEYALKMLYYKKKALEKHQKAITKITQQIQFLEQIIEEIREEMKKVAQEKVIYSDN